MTADEPKLHTQYPVRYKPVRVERAQALIVQNGNAYQEGLLEFRDWQRIR